MAIPDDAKLHPQRRAAMTWLVIWKGVVAISATVMALYYITAAIETARDAIQTAPRAAGYDR
jgi:hypothetical protein